MYRLFFYGTIWFGGCMVGKQCEQKSTEIYEAGIERLEELNQSLIDRLRVFGREYGLENVTEQASENNLQRSETTSPEEGVNNLESVLYPSGENSN